MFCYECKDFPCPGLKKIDERYRTRYHVSFIENLKCIEKNGMRKFLASERKKYRCTECCGVVSIHGGKCYDCLRDALTK